MTSIPATTLTPAALTPAAVTPVPRAPLGSAAAGAGASLGRSVLGPQLLAKRIPARRTAAAVELRRLALVSGRLPADLLRQTTEADLTSALLAALLDPQLRTVTLVRLLRMVGRRVLRRLRPHLDDLVILVGPAGRQTLDIYLASVHTGRNGDAVLRAEAAIELKRATSPKPTSSSLGTMWGPVLPEARALDAALLAAWPPSPPGFIAASAASCSTALPARTPAPRSRSCVGRRPG